MRTALKEQPSIFDVPAGALICNLCGMQKTEDVTNPGDERTVRCRGRWNGGPCPNISLEGRIGRYGFRIGEHTPAAVNYRFTNDLRLNGINPAPDGAPAGDGDGGQGPGQGTASAPLAETEGLKSETEGSEIETEVTTMKEKPKKKGNRGGGRKPDYDAQQRKAIGARLKAARDTLTLSQRTMGKEAGISQRVMSLMETGDIVMKHHLKAICKAHNVAEEWLIDGKGEMRPQEGAKVAGTFVPEPSGGAVHYGPIAESAAPAAGQAAPGPDLTDRPAAVADIRAPEGPATEGHMCYDEPTCIICSGTEQEISRGGGCSWVALNEWTKAGLCSQCAPDDRVIRKTRGLFQAPERDAARIRSEVEELHKLRHSLAVDIGRLSQTLVSLADAVAIATDRP